MWLGQSCQIIAQSYRWKQRIESSDSFPYLPSQNNIYVPSCLLLSSFLAGPNTGCFSRRWPLWVRENWLPKKLKNNFLQDKFYSLNSHARFFTVLIYLLTWRAAKLGIFTHFTLTNLPRCSQSMNSLIYVYSIQIPSCFLWVLHDSRDRTFCAYCRPKKLRRFLIFVFSRREYSKTWQFNFSKC